MHSTMQPPVQRPMQRSSYVDRFEENARARPAAAALATAAGEVSYGALDARAQRLARRLARLGAGKGVIVGLFLDADETYVAALLGAGKTGGAFLPLPPDLPPLRVAACLAKAECGIVVTLGRHRAALDAALAEAGRSVAVIEADAPDDAGDALPVARTIGPHDPCYVMFTSGSTGAPKAILGPHRSLSHFLRWEVGEFGLDETVRGSWLAPVTFDVSLRDILVPLMAGGTLCIPDAETRMVPRKLVDWLAREKVTLVHCVPTVLRLITRELADRGGDAGLAVRHLLVAGEPLLGADVAAWRAAAGGRAEVVNLYGPSETTLAKVFHRIGELPADPRRVLPIGRPLPDTSVLVLSNGRLCGPQQIGEIHIRTAYPSLGYLNDAALTAASFIRNPLGNDDADIVYKTGDLGRYLPDGTVECLGRQDNQVKVNGVRIELAEIEVALRALAGIAKAAAAAVHAGGGADPVLVGYYVPDAGAAPSAEAIKAQLGRILPAAMLPHVLVRLDDLPRTISGKLNRKALPRPEELFYAEHAYVAPQGETEDKLAAIWREIFGLTRVGVETAFHDFGGDSLRAIRAVQKIFQTFSVEISLKDFLAAATIRELARLVAAAGPAPVSAIARAADAASYPATPAQNRLWRLDRLGIAPTAYNLTEACELLGPVDEAALERAFRDLIGRHESLRTTFEEDADGNARQIVHHDTPWRLERVDLRRHAEPDRAAALLARDNAGHRFDLHRGPLLRVVLARLPDAEGAARHVLLFNIHHIVADVWSLGVLVREVAALYAAALAGRDAGLAPPALQLRDVAVWQAGRAAAGALDGDRAYWLERFSALPAPLDLPADRPRPPVQTFNGTTRRFRLPADLTGQLDGLARRHGTTRFAVVTALTKALLHRYTGQTDIVVGSPVAGRTDAALADQIGYYVNTLALRDTAEAGARFADLLARVAATVREGLAHQDYPFDALVQELPLERDMSRSPLFDVMVVDHAFEDGDLRLEGVRVMPFGDRNAWNFSRFDLVFHFQDEADELVLDLNYNTDLFDDARILRMGAHFAELARAAAGDESQAVGELNLLPADESRELAAFTHGPVVARDAAATIVSTFVAAARRHAGRPAVIDAGGRVLSYGALDGATDRLAHDLIAAHGVAPGERVAVFARRTPESVAAMLAVMKAGGVYVPIDPDYPAARIRFMLRQAGCRLALADSGAAPVADVQVVAVAPRLAAGDAAQPVDRSGAGEAAYVIFTSGSSGEPKGVAVAHGGFVNMSSGQIALFGLTPEDRVLQFASPSFDASLANMFMALFSGAAVVLPSAGDIENTADFLALLARSGTTALTLPPTYLRALRRAELAGVRVLITAGEEAPAADLLHYAQRLAAFNAYGPTEFSVCATVHEVSERDRDRLRLPIGRPLPNTSLHVLDAALKPAPVGIAGEIWLGGSGLALGYEGDAAQTAARFVTHPHTGERLYRTGDRGAWREDGAVDFLGRADDQVKVAGHRIEPGEIEAAMRAVPGVRDAHVATVARADGSAALAAWYCADERVELWPSVAEFYVYDDIAYGSMAADEGRNRRYREAFARHLPGRTAVDIGTGPVAILARLAIEAGARKVYAIDRLEATARKARETVAALGLDDRITVIHGDALTLELPETVDFCISEIVGAIGGAEGAARIINGARRYLKDPAAMLPQFSDTRIAALALPHDRLAPGFSDIAAHYVDKIFAEVGQPFDLRLCLKNLPREAIVSTDAPFEYLDYTREVPVEATHTVELVVTRDSEITGFLVWLRLGVDADAVVDILDNPGSWLPVWLPAFAVPVAVAAGDRIAITIARRLCGNGFNVDFFLDGTVTRAAGEAVPFACRSAHFGDGFRRTPFHAGLFAGEGVPRFEAPTPAVVRRHLLGAVPAHAVPSFLVPLDRLPVTINGKIDRAALPAPGDVAEGARRGEALAPQTPLERQVLDVWREIMSRPDMTAGDDFFSMGGDSIRAIQIVSRLRQLGWKAEIRDVFQNPTVAQFAGVLAPVRARADQGAVVGPAPLTPVQRWFLETSVRPDHFNQAVVLHAEAIDAAAAQAALEAVWRHHDALRAVFTHDGGGWSQSLLPPGEPPRVVEIAADDPAAFAEAARAVQAGFRIDRGPLLVAALLARGAATTEDAGGSRLLLCAHHLVMDIVSWGILIEDFTAAYLAHQDGTTPRLPDKTDSCRDHARALESIAARVDWTGRLGYWRALERDAPLLPGFAGPFRVADAFTLQGVLAAGVTAALLGPANHAYTTGTEDLLLAALALAIERHFSRAGALVTVESHGREYPLADLLGDGEAPDVTRTVGWFTAFHPFRLEAASGIGETVRGVKEALRRVPDRGWSHLLMRTLPAEWVVPDLRPQIGFNYLGQMRSAPAGVGPFAVDWDAPGGAVAADAHRPHAIDVLAMAVDGELRVSLDVDEAAIGREAGEVLLRRFLAAIEEVVAHCLARETAELTPSDMTYDKLSLDDLDRLLLAE